jgi:hypothetical protein
MGNKLPGLEEEQAEQETNGSFLIQGLKARRYYSISKRSPLDSKLLSPRLGTEYPSLKTTRPRFLEFTLRCSQEFCCTSALGRGQAASVLEQVEAWPDWHRDETLGGKPTQYIATSHTTYPAYYQVERKVPTLQYISCSSLIGSVFVARRLRRPGPRI